MKLLRLPRFAIFTAIRRASLRATTPLKAVFLDGPGRREAARQVDHPQKGKDRPFHDSRSPPNACYSIYPLVTTGAAGGGAFPLPTYCAQPATLRRANAAAVTRASVFMAPSFVMTTRNQ
jgi:hypothetical protein